MLLNRMSTYISLKEAPATRKGNRSAFPGHYALNPQGKPHAAFVGQEMVAFVLCAGEPDEIKSFEVIDGK